MPAPRGIAASVAVAMAAACFAAPGVALATDAPTRVAIIVGPVGETLTPIYIDLAERAAEAAETRGAVVARAYSPNATPENVLAAVAGANLVVYLGHGVGTPNPYSDTPDPAATNGWGLQGPNARGDHSDSSADGTLRYYGESWIAANVRPAPGWVMIYSNACYAAGAGEQQLAEDVTPEVAAERVATYSRAPLGPLGASAYFATDFYEGAARLIAALLDGRDVPYGRVFASEPNFDGAGLSVVPHQSVSGADVWLHRSPYFDGRLDYWYAFAGNPNATFGGSTTPGGGEAVAYGEGSLAPGGPPPLVAVGGVVSGHASFYWEQPGWSGEAVVALPAELGGAIPGDHPPTVLVCAERCAALPVVDACPCYVGTPDQRVANLSAAAWSAITDAPLDDGLVHVEVHLRPASGAEASAPLAARTG